MMLIKFVTITLAFYIIGSDKRVYPGQIRGCIHIIFFLFLHGNNCCAPDEVSDNGMNTEQCYGYSFEVPRQDSSNEYSQHCSILIQQFSDTLTGVQQNCWRVMNSVVDTLLNSFGKVLLKSTHNRCSREEVKKLNIGTANVLKFLKLCFIILSTHKRCFREVKKKNQYAKCPRISNTCFMFLA